MVGLIQQRSPPPIVWIFGTLPSEQASPFNPMLIGVLLSLAAVATLTTMDAVAKLIFEGDLHLMQLLAMRSVLITAVLLGYHLASSRMHQLRANRPKAQWLRGLIGSIAPIAFFGALHFLPLTDATVVAYTSVFVIAVKVHGSAMHW